MTDKTTIDLFMAVNAAGEWRIDTDADQATQTLADEETCDAIRTNKISVGLTLPTTAEISVDVPDEAGETVTAVAAE